MQEIFFRLPPQSVALFKSIKIMGKLGMLFGATIAIGTPGLLAPLNSSNGLILLYNSYFGKEKSMFIVYNPSNADYTTLPIPPSLVIRPDSFLRTKRGVHWLLEPSGVIAYTIRNKQLHSFTSAPGDLAYIDDEGYSNCVRKMTVEMVICNANALVGRRCAFAGTGVAGETLTNTHATVPSPENTAIPIFFHEGNAELVQLESVYCSCVHIEDILVSTLQMNTMCVLQQVLYEFLGGRN
ncbi:unnamed protein product [Dovyalis caffra]|uniref:Uncharacterized protein n=1 Tax=Dovyalis caffra TaxID=77055 RepID=A0AAV1SNC7_9ROSI|nr:unnamed protein product [Dovyalis caffra]